WGRLGMVLLAHLFDREADSCFAQAARLDPEDAMWPYARGIIALRREPDKAVPLLRQAVAATSSASDYRFPMSMQLAEALLERGNLDEAEELFREEANQPRAALGLGLIAVARGDAALASKYLAVARTSQFARKKAAVQLAGLARGRGETAAAEALDQEIARLPDDPPWPDPLLDPLVRLQVGRRGRERRAAQL